MRHSPSHAEEGEQRILLENDGVCSVTDATGTVLRQMHGQQHADVLLGSDNSLQLSALYCLSCIELQHTVVVLVLSYALRLSYT